MRRSRGFGVLLLLSVLPHSGLAAQNLDQTEAALAREVLVLTQAADQAVSVMERAIEGQRGANPAIPAVFWDRFLKKATERKNELIELLVPVYVDTFSADDLRGLIAFYRSPVGKRLLESQPNLVQASMEAGEMWGAELGKQVAEELEAEGVKLD